MAMEETKKVSPIASAFTADFCARERRRRHFLSHVLFILTDPDKHRR
jgi:hypothetical protein